MSMQIGLETPVANFSFKNAVKLFIGTHNERFFFVLGSAFTRSQKFTSSANRLKAELRTGANGVSKWVSSKIRERIVFGFRSETKSRRAVKRDG